MQIPIYHKKTPPIIELLSQNKTCFDCTAKSPTFINATTWTFVCFKCAGYLREFNQRIKSVSSSTFSPEEIDQLKKWGNVNAKGKWLATWDPQNDPIPSPMNSKRIKDFMIRKYVDKLYFWDPEGYPQDEPMIIPPVQELPNLLLDSSHGSESTLWNSPPPPQWKSESVKKTLWKADFASAFPPPRTNSSLETTSPTKQTPDKPPTLQNIKTAPISTPQIETISPLSIDTEAYTKDDFWDPLKSSKPIVGVKKSTDPFSDLLGLDLSSAQEYHQDSSIETVQSISLSNDLFGLHVQESVSTKKKDEVIPVSFDWSCQWTTPASPPLPSSQSIPSPKLQMTTHSIWDSPSTPSISKQDPVVEEPAQASIKESVQDSHLGVELDQVWASKSNVEEEVVVGKSDLDKEVSNVTLVEQDSSYLTTMTHGEQDKITSPHSQEINEIHEIKESITIKTFTENTWSMNKTVDDLHNVWSDM